MSTAVATDPQDLCKHCGESLAVRNPTGYCDHLFYPENCRICKDIHGKFPIETDGKE